MTMIGVFLKSDPQIQNCHFNGIERPSHSVNRVVDTKPINGDDLSVLAT
jgi:hypothetical protein